MRLIDADKFKEVLSTSAIAAALLNNTSAEKLIKAIITVLDEQPTVNPLQEVLDGIEELKRSPWYRIGTYVEVGTRREAVDIIEKLCVKEVMKKYDE